MILFERLVYSDSAWVKYRGCFQSTHTAALQSTALLTAASSVALSARCCSNSICGDNMCVDNKEVHGAIEELAIIVVQTVLPGVQDSKLVEDYFLTAQNALAYATKHMQL